MASRIADKLSNFLENAFKKAFSNNEEADVLDASSEKDSSFLYDTIQEYKDAGYHFRRTKDQMSRGLTREEAFEEFSNDKKK